jgi:hypothetical protein
MKPDHAIGEFDMADRDLAGTAFAQRAMHLTQVDKMVLQIIGG